MSARRVEPARCDRMGHTHRGCARGQAAAGRGRVHCRCRRPRARSTRARDRDRPRRCAGDRRGRPGGATRCDRFAAARARRRGLVSRCGRRLRRHARARLRRRPPAGRDRKHEPPERQDHPARAASGPLRRVAGDGAHHRRRRRPRGQWPANDAGRADRGPRGPAPELQATGASRRHRSARYRHAHARTPDARERLPPYARARPPDRAHRGRDLGRSPS